MYYVISKDYHGPNSKDAKWIDYDHFIVSTEPATTNLSHEVRLDGWCGTTNDIAVYAHGEFETKELAEAAIQSMLAEAAIQSMLADDGFRQLDIDPDDYDNQDGDGDLVVVARYKPGRYEPMQDSTGWCYPARDEIDADTTDERIAEIVAECEDAANSEGVTLDLRAVEKMLTDHRNELRDERDLADE